jgi:homoserine kinase type II
MTELADVLAEWGVSAGSVNPAPGGSLNSNFDVGTLEGRFFLRLVRSNLETERILGEHALVRWVAERGVPAPMPLPLPSGESVLRRGTERWVLFPWAEGKPGPRGRLTARACESLGAAHGLVQAVLAEHPESAGAAFAQRWDGDTSRRDLASLIALGRQKGAPGVAMAAMERQLTLLERAEVLPPRAFAGLPSQLLHGDFHDQQALFAGDRVTAVVDWEIWHVDSRACELVRSLAFSQLLDSPNLEAYLAGYRRFVRLTPGEVTLALRLWFQSRLTGLWLWYAYLVEGNERLEGFFAESARQLELQADPAWVRALSQRVVAAACE